LIKYQGGAHLKGKLNLHLDVLAFKPRERGNAEKDRKLVNHKEIKKGLKTRRGKVGLSLGEQKEDKNYLCGNRLGLNLNCQIAARKFRDMEKNKWTKRKKRKDENTMVRVT